MALRLVRFAGGDCLLARLIVAAIFVVSLYASTAMAATESLWFERGRPSAQAREAVQLLLAAASHGLVPDDYEARKLALAVDLAGQGPPDEVQTIERLEMSLTHAMQRYLKDLNRGRIDPRQLHHNFTAPRREAFDPVAYLRTALVQNRLTDAANEAAPTLPQYAALRERLMRYRKLIDHPAWQRPLPPLPSLTKAATGTVGVTGATSDVRADQEYAGLEQLKQRLITLGDLAPDTPTPARYEGALIEGVKTFQRRHALPPAGILGKATLAQLQMKPAQRVRQIELTMERLRWTPLLQSPRMVVINVPEFVLRAYEVSEGKITLRKQMKVIVGKALDTRTPLFDEDMRYIEFSPYWNVPPSIARDEIVPLLRRDPAYLEREGFEFVALADGQVSRTVTTEQLDAVLAGAQRIRQRPGPKNALGDIKFVFPNRENIYLHHTPAKQLFGRDRRDFSHGCIRVEQPLALAQFVLEKMPQWNESRIREAMSKGQSSTLRLSEPVHVLIGYATALVQNGRINFFEDIYGYDQVLEQALQQRLRSRPNSN